MIGAAVCFFVAFLTIPVIALRPSKFALSFRYVQFNPYMTGWVHGGSRRKCGQFGELACDVWVSLSLALRFRADG